MARKKRKGNGGVKRFFGRLGKGIGTVFLVLGISLVIFACIFTAYLRNYLMPQVSFSLDSFRLNQTSVIYYENKATGNFEPLQNLYGEENRIWPLMTRFPRI